MTGVEFEEDKNILYGKFETDNKVPKLVEYIMKATGIEDTKKINYIIIAFVILLIVISFFLFSSGDEYKKISPSDSDYVPAEI